MAGSPVMSNWMRVNLLRNNRNSKGKMGAAVIGLCACRQEKFYFRMLDRLSFQTEILQLVLQQSLESLING